MTIPGDKSISHRVALLSLLADDTCKATGWLVSEDTLASLAAVEALGSTVVRNGDRVEIRPPQKRPSGPLTIDCGNSGTTCRLMCGLLAGWLPETASVTLKGDKSLSSRPMNRVVAPLLEMGALIEYLAEEGRLPLRITGAPLHGRRHVLAVPSAQVKSALLLAGLNASGVTTVAGGGDSRDHTELMLSAMGVEGMLGKLSADVSVTANPVLRSFEMRVPGDPSTAAFLQVAAALIDGSDLTTSQVSLNPTRAGALQVFRNAGVNLSVMPEHDKAAGEPIGEVRTRPEPLMAFKVGALEMPSLIDEIPILAVLATAAVGETVITGAAELRVKESDRLALMTKNLKMLGAQVVERPDGMRVVGPVRLKGGAAKNPIVFETGGDHRVAMAMSIAALISEGECTLDDFECVAVSFPEFFTTIDKLIATISAD
ncbi:MAG: 3-phosphoshikimate 1-carboxyvinyltransferase [Candidatus Krumholzibacteriia bacterium]